MFLDTNLGFQVVVAVRSGCESLATVRACVGPQVEMHTEMALEIAELPRQFVADFAFKVVSVDAARVAVDVVLADVVLADDGIGLVADALDDAVGHRGVLLCECLRSVVVNVLTVD